MERGFFLACAGLCALEYVARHRLECFLLELEKHIGVPYIRRVSYGKEGITGNDPEPEEAVLVDFLQYAD